MNEALVTSVEATYAEATAEAAFAVIGESHTADPAPQVGAVGALVEEDVDETIVVFSDPLWALDSVTVTVALVRPLAS